jgi:Mg/Co/Ni transporter MgtE
MGKKIEKLTQEQEAQIPVFIEKWTRNVSTPMDRAKATAAIKAIYKDMGEKEPLIIYGDSPWQTSMLAWLFLGLFNSTQLYNELYNELYNKLDNELVKELVKELYNKLDNELYNELYNKLDKELVKELYNKLDNELYNELVKELYNKLDNELVKELGNKLDNKLCNKLYNKLDKELVKELYNKLDNELYNELYNKLDNELVKELYNKLDNELYNELDNKLDKELYNKLDNELVKELDNKLNNKLYNELYNKLDKELNNKLVIKLDNELNNKLCNKLNSHLKEQLKLVCSCFYVSVWWSAWAGYYEYAQYIGVKFNKQKYDLFMNFIEHVHFIIPFDGVCFVSEKAKNIHWDDRDRLHSDNSKAVEYPDGWGLYSINGVKVPEKVVLAPETITIEEIQSETNLETRRVMIERYGPPRYLEALDCTVLDADIYNQEIDVLDDNLNPTKTTQFIGRTLVQEPNGNKWFIGTDSSTERVYHMYIGEERPTTCKEAHEMLSGLVEKNCVSQA